MFFCLVLSDSGVQGRGSRRLLPVFGWQRGRREEGEEENTSFYTLFEAWLSMLALINRILDWFKSLFWKEEMELTLVGLQYSGKTTFVNVIAVSCGYCYYCMIKCLWFCYCSFCYGYFDLIAMRCYLRT